MIVLRIPLLSPQMLLLRPSNSPLTAFKFLRISSGSWRGVHELRRRLLFVYCGIVNSGSTNRVYTYNYRRLLSNEKKKNENSYLFPTDFG